MICDPVGGELLKHAAVTARDLESRLVTMLPGFPINATISMHTAFLVGTASLDGRGRAIEQRFAIGG